MSTSSDEAKRRLGVGQLRLLVDSQYLNADDYPLVQAAIDSALAPELTAWDSDVVVESLVVEPQKEADP